jgi:hypothetical protein
MNKLILLLFFIPGLLMAFDTDECGRFSYNKLYGLPCDAAVWESNSTPIPTPHDKAPREVGGYEPPNYQITAPREVDGYEPPNYQITNTARKNNVIEKKASLDEYKSACQMIGFTPATPDFGDCVLELRRKDKNKQSTSQQYEPNEAQQDTAVEDNWSPPVAGDASQEDILCQEYGFIVGKPDYNQCKLTLDMAKQEAEAQDRLYQEQVRQYEQQKRAYEAQVAEAKKKENSKAMFNLLMYGLNRASGKTYDEAAPALYGLPAYPKQPRTIIQPMPIQPIGGNSYQCSWDTWRKVYNCR